MNMDMQSACAEILDEVDGALGCIVIDMQTGLTVAAKSRPGRTMNPATVNLVSVVSTNMFCGKLIGQFEQALGRPQAPSPSFVREVQMTTENTNQFMAAIPGWERGLLVLVTDKTVSLGLGWMAVHRGIAMLGEAPRPPLPAQDDAPRAADWPAPDQYQEATQQGRFGAAGQFPEAPPAPARVGEGRGEYSVQPSPPAPPQPPPRPAQPAADAPVPYAAQAQPAGQVRPREEVPSAGQARPLDEARPAGRARLLDDAPPPELTETRYYRDTRVEGAQAAQPAPAAAPTAAKPAARQTPPPAKGAPITAKERVASASKAAAKKAAKEEGDAAASKGGPPKGAALGPRMNLFAARQRKGGKK